MGRLRLFPENNMDTSQRPLVIGESLELQASESTARLQSSCSMEEHSPKRPLRYRRRAPLLALSVGLTTHVRTAEGVKRVNSSHPEEDGQNLLNLGARWQRERRSKASDSGDAVIEPLRREQENLKGMDDGKGSEGGPVCCEVVRGVRKEYITKVKRGAKQGFGIRKSAGSPDIWQQLVEFGKTWVLPEGYPESVSPSFGPYMRWRAVQYFFGGAMGVFTTRSLLHAVGVARGDSVVTATAVAVNWAIKDGAGRIGKMVVARHGKKFDCDLKQLRFAGDLLMQLGAGVELATMSMPHFFLPLACAANVAKNVAAVTATSTRAPIYKAFARRENIGDVTAKGESISNLSDLLGTGLGILLSKWNPPLAATFAVLSCGYLLSSYQEVKAISVPTLNRARFHVAVRTFLECSRVPPPAEANAREPVIVFPWADEQPMELGTRVTDAFTSPEDFLVCARMFQDEKYVVSYRSNKRRAYVILKEDAGAEDVLRGAFHAHVLLHLLHGSPSSPPGMSNDKSSSAPSSPLVTTSGGPLPAPLRPRGRRELLREKLSRSSDGEDAGRSLFPSPSGREGGPEWDGEGGSSEEMSSSHATAARGRRESRLRGPHGWRPSENEAWWAVAESCKHTRELFDLFKEEASRQGWTMSESLLNPGGSRLCTS